MNLNYLNCIIPSVLVRILVREEKTNKCEIKETKSCDLNVHPSKIPKLKWKYEVELLAGDLDLQSEATWVGSMSFWRKLEQGFCLSSFCPVTGSGRQQLWVQWDPIRHSICGSRITGFPAAKYGIINHLV